MSTGNAGLDILLNQIRLDAISKSEDGLEMLRHRFPSLPEGKLREIHSLVVAASRSVGPSADLVITAPPSFALQSKTTKVVVRAMLESAKSSILITSYSLSDYFSEMIDCIIRKSQEGVLVKVYVNDIDHQERFAKILRYKGRFLEIYNYPQRDDHMSALHAKVISIDGRETLITSANLSYHGQEGNIELGTRIVSKDIARKIDKIFTQLLFKKVFVKV